MNFSVNHPILYVIAGLIILVVLAQSAFFLFRALARARELGMDKSILRKTMASAAIFTIAPAVAIVISVLALSKKLGLALPWLRLSVVGSMSYETIAASNALQAMGQTMGSGSALTAQQYVNVLLVMTISIMVGIITVPLIAKKLLSGLSNLSKRDAKWADIFQSALFLGMISAFVGFVFSDISRLWNPVEGYSATSGLIPVLVMVVSMAVMVCCGLLMRKPKLKWLSEYAMPISLVAGMASAIPFTAWLS